MELVPHNREKLLSSLEMAKIWVCQSFTFCCNLAEKLRSDRLWLGLSLYKRFLWPLYISSPQDFFLDIQLLEENNDWIPITGTAPIRFSKVPNYCKYWKPSHSCTKSRHCQYDVAISTIVVQLIFQNLSKFMWARILNIFLHNFLLYCGDPELVQISISSL